MDNFTYSCHFNVSSDMLNQKRVVLWFEGLDTIANIYVNNQLVGVADNMFRRWIFDILPYLSKQSETKLSIEFQSSACYAKSKANAAGYIIPESRYQVNNLNHHLYNL